MPYTAEQVRSRHPFELLFLGVAVAQGMSGLASTEVRPGSIEEGVGHGGTLVWYFAILLSGLAALVGIYWPDRATGLLLEAVGLFTVGICTIFYGVAALILLGGIAFYPSLTLLGYGVAAVWRANQIRRFLATVAEEHSSEPGE